MKSWKDLYLLVHNICKPTAKATTLGRYRINGRNLTLVENNAGEIVTFIKDVTKHGLKNLAKNYGWY